MHRPNVCFKVSNSVEPMSVLGRYGDLSIADPYAHVSTMHRGPNIAGVDPCSDEPLRLAVSAHSYSVCRNRSNESGAL